MRTGGGRDHDRAGGPMSQIADARVPRARRSVLVTAPFPPRLDATNGGSRVLGELVAALSTRHDLAVLYLRARGEPSIDDALARRCSLVQEVARDRATPFSTRLRRRIGPLLGVPTWAAYLSVDEFAVHVRRLADQWKPDVVHFEYHVMGQYANALPDRSAARVLTEHEPGVLAAREHMAVRRGVIGLWDWLERRAWERYERRVLANVNAVVVFTTRDRLELQPLAGATPIVVIPFHTALPPRPIAQERNAAVSADVLFVGSFVHPPNTDAARRLVEAIFPRVRRRVGEATLHIVGENPPARLRRASGPGVRLTGRVPDVTPYLVQAAVVIPLRLGGGMRVKTLEALAAGKAVVASPRALEGLDVTDGVEVIVSESDDAFADAIASLLVDAHRREALGRAARAWAEQYLSPERWLIAYERLYDDLLIRGPGVIRA
jgi:polysaccharide biosynthesis protein PslH